MARAGLNADAIISVAARIADEVGYDSLSLATLSKRLSIKPPSLYKHLDGLPAIQRGLALRALEELNGLLMRAIVGLGEVDAVLAIARTYWQFSRQHPGSYQAIVRFDRNTDAGVSAAVDVQIGLIGAVLRGCQLEGERLQQTIVAVHALLHGFSSLSATKVLDNDPNGEKALIQGVRSLIGADDLAGRPQARTARKPLFRWGTK